MENSPRDRVIVALKRQDGVIPYHADFTIQEHAKMVEYFNDVRFEDRYEFCMDVATYGGFEEIKPGFFRDSFGVVWNRSGADKDIGVLDGAVIPDISDYHYVFPEPDEAMFRAKIEAMLARDNGRFKVAELGFSTFERAWTLQSLTDALYNMAAEPLKMDQLMTDICAFNLKVIDIALSYDAVDCVHFGDDWGQQKGLMMGIHHFRRFMKPVLKAMYAKVRGAGKYVSQHSCGDIGAVFPELIDMGLNIYQTFQPEIYDINAFKKEYGKDLAVWGGISTQRLLPFGTPEFVYDETRRIMGVMGDGGGYIACPTHAVPGDVPAENIEAMLRAFVAG